MVISHRVGTRSDNYHLDHVAHATRFPRMTTHRCCHRANCPPSPSLYFNHPLQLLISDLLQLNCSTEGARSFIRFVLLIQLLPPLIRVLDCNVGILYVCGTPIFY
ncbi:hypothetical protein GUJ93_ZPchr0002g26528 [Zizania palustris]|uniref:Uncharacterized protein n=1 Tax=Zizania palustris TaxID=103762 RepID=A0A8J5SDH1_ZIZPA|nr:hypothetical protein GUJ93_ZPchr0002g26528 [Zizania palustris]